MDYGQDGCRVLVYLTCDLLENVQVEFEIDPRSENRQCLHIVQMCW